MKKFLGTRLGVILVTMLVCMVIFGSVAFAATISRDVPASGVILKANPGLGVYSDAACTVEFTAFTFPDVLAGGSVVLPPVYVKNTGNKDFTSVDVTNNFNAAYGTITSYSTNSGPLIKGTSRSYTITLASLDGVTSDTPFSCVFSFIGNY